MYRYRRPESPWPRMILLIAVGAAILLAAVVFTLPRVAAFGPQGSNLSALSPVTFTFNADMNPTTVESRVRIEPAVAGRFSWAGRTLQFTPQAEWPAGPVRVRLLAGATSTLGLPVLFDTAWEFNVGAPGLAYLLRVGDKANLYIQTFAPEAGPQPVTDERFGVAGFDLTPDAARFVYAALRADGGADLKLISRDGSGLTDLLACPNDRCTAPAVSPDGRVVAFERHPIGSLDRSTLEVLDLNSGAITIVDGDPAHIARFPIFARDGRLAYLNLYEQVIVIHDLASGASTRLRNTSGQIGTWSPDGQYLVFPEITSGPPPTTAPGTPAPVLQIDTFFSHLRRISVADGLSVDLSGPGAVEDANAAYSPSGEWLAFGRKQLEQELWTPGRQLWVMRSDGSEPRALTNDPLYNHSHFVWNPDGTQIVFVRFDVTDPAGLSEIWIINANGSGARKLVSGGFLPRWLP